MKLTYLVQYYYPEKASGLQLVEDLLEGFAAHQWTVNVFTPTPTRGVTKEQRKEYSVKRTEKRFNNYVVINRMRLFREKDGFLQRTLRYLIFSIECFYKCITFPSDFIFTGSGPPTQGAIAGFAKHFSKATKVIYNLQDIFPDSLVTSGICSSNSFLYKAGRKLEDYTYKHADVIITISDEMKNNVLNKGVSPEKVEVVRNWIDTDKIRPIAREQNGLFEELNLPRDKFYVVYAGNLGRVQGVEILAAAAENLLDRNDISFVIFGEGSEEQHIKKLIEQLPNAKMFPLQSPERISEVYSLGNVCVIPCKKGTAGSGMPSKTWSVMASGSAIIASFDRGGEMEDVLDKAACGVCVTAGDAQALTEAILNLSNNQSLVKEMGNNARIYAERFCSKEKAVEQYIQIIENVVNEC